MLRATRRTSRTTRAIVAGFSFSLAPLFTPRAAAAGGPLGRQGSAVQTSDYALDIFQGPVLASSRITAMGGAYAGLADSVDGIPFNPAAASQRAPYSTRRTDYDLTAGVTAPSSIARTDFENNGKPFGYRNFIWATVGGMIQHGHWGFGAILSVQNYALGAPPRLAGESTDVSNLTVRLFKVDAVVSYGFMDDQLHVGGGARGAVFTASDTGERLLLGSYGLGAQAGVLWRPAKLPLRVGGTVRSPVFKSFEVSPHVTENPGTGDRLIGSFYLPRGVELPWEAEWGVAVQVGPRPLNLGWTDQATLREPPGDARRTLRRRYRALPREKILLSYAMLVTGPTANAVGVTSMLAQKVDRSGEKTTVTLRGGAEAEIVPNRLQLRAGSYMEPTRFRESSPRLHATGGFELRVVDWSMFGLFPEDNAFRVSAAADGARGYFGWSVGFGSWY